MNIKKLLVLIVFCIKATHAGVYITCDIPRDVSQKITELVCSSQQLLICTLEEINEHEQGHLCFQLTQFTPHFSLAFVSQKQISADAALQEFSDLDTILEIVACEYSAFGITCTNLSLEYWPGKLSFDVNGNKITNYLNVVLKLSENFEFLKLAERIAELLQEKYGIKQAFSPTMHITLGRIYQKNNAPIQGLETQLPMLIPLHLRMPIIFTAFKLKGHDGTEKVFKLSGLK